MWDQRARVATGEAISPRDNQVHARDGQNQTSDVIWRDRLVPDDYATHTGDSYFCIDEHHAIA